MIPCPIDSCLLCMHALDVHSPARSMHYCWIAGKNSPTAPQDIRRLSAKTVAFGDAKFSIQDLCPSIEVRGVRGVRSCDITMKHAQSRFTCIRLCSG